jgi:hypothetical protein
MATVYRPAFGRPCYDGCGATVPTQRSQELIARAHARGDAFRPQDRVCVECERRRAREAHVTITRKPR